MFFFSFVIWMKKWLFRLGIEKNFFLNNFFSVVHKNNEIFLYNLKNIFIINVLNYFKNSIQLSFKYLTDVFVCDYVYYIFRFRIVYNLFSFYNKNNLFLNDSLKLLDKYISLFKIYKSSIWMEREIYDMFGIIFFNNWDLRKILTDYTFFGFPLRKDFPLSGFLEIYYNLKKKSIFESFIELMQELRFYVSSSYLEYWNQETL